MNLAHSLAGLSLVTIAACAAPNDSVDPGDDVQVDVVTGVTPMGPGRCLWPPSLPLDPPFTAGASGASDPDDPCDWYLREQPINNSNIAFRVTATSLAWQGIVIQTAALCAASTMTSAAYGQVGPYYTWENGVPIWHPGGQWEFIASKTETGTWFGSECGFPANQQSSGIGIQGSPGALPIYGNPNSPNFMNYTRVRIAMKSRLYATAGPTSGLQSMSSVYF